MAVTAKEITLKILADNTAFDKSVEETTKKLEDFKKATKDASELFTSLSKKAAVATTAIAGTGIAAAKLAVDFNAGFGMVQTLIPSATERIKELQRNVLELSPAVGKTTKDLTDGLYEIISAFGDSADSAKNLELAAKGATAGGATTKDAIKLLSAVTKAYGNTSNEAQKKVSDLAFTTVKLGQTSFPELAASIQRVTSQSNTLGVSQEELFAVFSSGTGVIGGTAEVSTKFSAVLTELQKPADRLAATFKALRVESGQQLIEKFGGLQGALAALKEQAERTGEPVSNLFGSAEAGKLALYAAGTGAKKFTDDLRAMKEAAGATEQAFSDATRSGPNAFGFQLQQAALHAHGFAIKIGQELLPSLQAILEPLFKGAEYLHNLDSETLQAIISVGKVVLSVTAVTAAVMGVIPAMIQAKTAIEKVQGAFKAFDAALQMNHIGLIVISVTAAIVAIKELCAWLDRAAEKERTLRLAAMDENTAFMKKAQGIRALAKEYATLNAQQKLTNQQSLRMKELAKELAEITGQPAGTVDESTGKTTARIENFVSGAHEAAAIKASDLEHSKQVLQDLEKAEAALTDRVKTYGESTSWAIAETLEHFALLPTSLKTVTSAKDGLLKVREEISKLKTDIKETEAGIAALKDVSIESFTPEAEPTTSPSVPPPPQGAARKGKEEKTQKERLAELDATFKMESELLEKQNLTAAQKQAEKEKLDESHYKKRLELLKTFHKENVTTQLKENGNISLTLEQSLVKEVGNAHQTIKEETAQTNAALARLADERHKKEIEAIKKTADETKKSVTAEVALKKELGHIEGATDAERTRNEHLAKAQGFLEKQNELSREYLRLKDSGNEKEQEKAKALKEQIDTLKEMERAEKKAAETVGKSFATAAQKVAEAFSTIGSAIQQLIQAIAQAGKAAIDNKETERKREQAVALAELEKEKNERLLELDNELSEQKEQKQAEDAEREEEKRNEEFEKQQAHSTRTIQELSGQLEAETNLEKLRNVEKQLEDARQKKAEAAAQKKEADEKRKREIEARIAEVQLLNAKAQAEHEYALARIQTENAAGDASAKAAQQAAAWQKAQGIVSMAIKAAIATAEAALEFAKPFGIGVPSGIMYTAAAVTAAVQGGIIATQPQPPDYIQQPLPAAPRPIKFAQGGIVLPSKDGTGITLPGGSPALVGEAGLAELILPLNAPNLEKMFKAAGVQQAQDNVQQVSYNPSYHIEITQNQHESFEEHMLTLLRSHDRELLHIIESGKQRWYVGG